MKQSSGNALFLILIAIALLGALTAFLVKSSSTTEETGSAEQTTIDATNAIKKGQAVAIAVEQLLLRGCAETQISFDPPPYDGSVGGNNNPNSPPDFSCHVFHPNGAGLKRMTSTIYDANHCISGFGTTPSPCTASAVELISTTRIPTAERCMRINTILGVTNPSGSPPAFSSSHTSFNGVYGPAGKFTIAGVVTGKKQACFMDTDGAGTGLYQVYTVLIAR